jgi:hypothetical protein
MPVKISDLTELLAPASGDMVATVDVDDLTDAASGTTKRLTLANLLTLVSSFSVTVDTRANILALAPADPALAYATDTERFYIYDGTSWRTMDMRWLTDLQAPDMGYEQDSPRTGYHEDWITDKTLNNILLGGNARTENGGLRVDSTQDPDTYEIYLRSAWQSILYDLTVENSDFRHTPLAEAIRVWSGMSVALSLSGRPIINEYAVSMGAFSPPRIIDGGTF